MAETPLVSEAFLRVRYVETDRMGIVYHANYAVWFEIGRTELCRQAGVVYRDLEESGFLLVVAELGVRYASPAQYDDELVVRTCVAELGSRTVRFDYEVARVADGVRLASGFTRHVFLDAKTRRPVRGPAGARALFARYFAGD